MNEKLAQAAWRWVANNTDRDKLGEWRDEEVRKAFTAGAEWQGRDDAVMRMLGSIENRLMEIQSRVPEMILMVAEKVIANRANHSDLALKIRSSYENLKAENDRIRDAVIDVGQKCEAVRDALLGHHNPVDWPAMDVAEGVPLEENENFTSFGKTMPIGYCGLVPPIGVAEERGPRRKRYGEKGGTMFGLERALVDDDVVREPTKDNRKEYVGRSPPHGTVVGGFRFGEDLNGEDLNFGSEKLRPSKVLREPVTDESGVSTGAGAGPLVEETKATFKTMIEWTDHLKKVYPGGGDVRLARVLLSYPPKIVYEAYVGQTCVETWTEQPRPVAPAWAW